MPTPTKDSKNYTNIPPPPPKPPVTRSEKADFDLRHIPTKIGLDTSEIENVIVTQKIKLSALIESITEGHIKGMSNISYGGQLSILRLQRWCQWYHTLNGGKLQYWLTEFTGEAFFDDFQDNEQEQSTDIKSHRSANITKTTTDAYINFRVKLSEFPTFTGKSNNWYNFNIDFDVVADVAVLGELFEFDPSEQLDHLEIRDENEKYYLRVKKLYKIFKKVTARGSANTNIQAHESMKDGVLAYADIKYYYDLDGEKNIYGKTQLIDILSLELHYNSPGGFDK